MLKVYETSIAGANALSVNGAFTKPDDDDYNGKAGEAKEQKLVLAPAQTTLAEDIDDVQTRIKINHAIFDDSDYPYIIVVSGENTEIMEITDGSGTTTLEVTRGDSPISASADDPVYNAYDYQIIKIQASDEEGSDESSYVQYAPDSGGSPGSYVSSLSPANLSDPTSDSYTFWRKITIPAGNAERKTDLRHYITFNAFEYAA